MTLAEGVVEVRPLLRLYEVSHSFAQARSGHSVGAEVHEIHGDGRAFRAFLRLAFAQNKAVDALGLDMDIAGAVDHRRLSGQAGDPAGAPGVAGILQQGVGLREQWGRAFDVAGQFGR